MDLLKAEFIDLVFLTLIIEHRLAKSDQAIPQVGIFQSGMLQELRPGAFQG
jgi:hypothetical protein